MTEAPEKSRRPDPRLGVTVCRDSDGEWAVSLNDRCGLGWTMSPWHARYLSRRLARDADEIDPPSDDDDDAPEMQPGDLGIAE